MSDNFERSMAFVFTNEGGYSNHPKDSGGETMLGITAETLARAYRAGLVDCQDVKKLMREDAAEIYKCFFWKPSKADIMSCPLCTVHFDAAVNHGIGGAGRLLQRAINALSNAANVVDVDGVVGPITIRAMVDAIGVCGVKAVCGSYLDERKILYDSIINRNETQNVFRRGWMARLERNRKFVEENAL